ncbi:asparagine synthetase B family protein [Longimicrobium sp.]|uniref:asparagine synthetase B family protein n=1 Tax=Longimicrobium sp. TaxID=2029185 RepID=UPI003B3A1D41
MSGIAGIVALDGAPVDAALLDRMAGSLASRGPDGTAFRSIGPAGFVHALLRTGDFVEDVPQPVSVDGRSWIVADARIDGRAELVRVLRAGGVHADAGAPAAELILHALRLWGDDAPAHLLGDFAFAAWDTERRRLLCARDLFGVKPFYYAATRGAFVFSNSIDCVRLHPAVSGELDEGWIADFLLHGDSQSTEGTVYAAIRHLPPGHLLTVEDGRMRIRRYASLPEDVEPLRLRGPAEYAEAFLEVLREAVADRLPRDRASILLSGGRDSTALAATWRDVVDRGIRSTKLRGYTAYHARLMPDDEPRFASMAAEALGIPLRLLPADDYAPFARWEMPELYRPQPTSSPLLALEADQLRQAAGHAPVLLTGQGADALLRESTSRLARLAAGGQLWTAAREAAQYARWHHRIPRPGVRTWLRERGGPRPQPIDPPVWIDPGFARRVGMAERLAAWSQPIVSAHPLRPEAHGLLSTPFWPILFPLWDPGVTGVPIEQRHPYLDLRLVRLALSIPPAQWYNDKGLLRIGMRGRLPAPVLARPKTPVAKDMLEVRAADLGDRWLGGRTADARVAPWVDLSRVPRLAGGASDAAPRYLYEDIRPLALSLWLAHHHR